MNPTLNWERVGTEFYRNIEGYSLEWDVDLSHVHACASVGGGLIAIWDRTDEIRQGVARKQQIKLYDGSGKHAMPIPWDNGSIVGAGFISGERFVVVSSLGHVRTYYDLRGNFDLAMVESPQRAEFGELAVVESPDCYTIIDGSRVEKLPLAQGQWTHYTTTFGVQETRIITFNDSKVALSTTGMTRNTLEVTASRVRPSRDGSLVAISHEGTTKVYDSDLVTLKTTVECSSPLWIGSQGLLEAVSRNDELECIVHDLGGSSCTLYFDPEATFIEELDGIRVLTNEAHNFLCKVPKDVVQIFMLGSSASAAVLLNCIDMLEQNSPRANESLSLISDLESAIKACLNAAAFEFDAHAQKKLLRGAHFGKTSLEVYDSTLYLQTLNKVRVANTLRAHDILCSVAQLERITPKGVLDMLQRREKWEVALGVAKLYRLPVESIPVSWACSQIQASEDDDEALQAQLAERLDKFAGLSYVDIGRTAFDEGRIQLAKEMIGKEPSAGKRVGLLLEMSEDDTALSQAVASCDSNLICFVLLALSKRLNLPQFYRVFSNNEQAIKCWQYMLEPAKLKEFNYQLDRQQDDFFMELKDAKADPKLVKSLRGQGYAKHALQDYGRLLELQEQLEKEFDSSFMGISAIATLSKLLEFGQVQRVLKLKSTLKVDDKQLWWLRIRELVKRRDWDGLLQFSQQKKSPIGYIPFYQCCKEAGNLDAAESYLELCTEAQRAAVLAE